jgi:hypothetical protein
VVRSPMMVSDVWGRVGGRICNSSSACCICTNLMHVCLAHAAAACCVCAVRAAGFAVCGFGMGEHFASRPKLLAAALQHLPAEKPRVVVGLVSDRI